MLPARFEIERVCFRVVGRVGVGLRGLAIVPVDHDPRTLPENKHYNVNYSYFLYFFLPLSVCANLFNIHISPVDNNTGPLPSGGGLFEGVLDIIVGVAVVPHHVRLQFVLGKR